MAVVPDKAVFWIYPTVQKDKKDGEREQRNDIVKTQTSRELTEDSVVQGIFIASLLSHHVQWSFLAWNQIATHKSLSLVLPASSAVYHNFMVLIDKIYTTEAAIAKSIVYLIQYVCRYHCAFDDGFWIHNNISFHSVAGILQYPILQYIIAWNNKYLKNNYKMDGSELWNIQTDKKHSCTSCMTVTHHC